MKKFYFRFCPILGFKSLIEIDMNGITIKEYSFIFDFFSGKRCQKRIVLKGVQSTTISSSCNFKQLVSSICFLLIGTLLIYSHYLIGNIFLCLGLIIFSSSIRTDLYIEKEESIYQISVPFFEEDKLFEIQNQINFVSSISACKNTNKINFE